MNRSVLKPCACGSMRRKMIHSLSINGFDIYYVRCPDCRTETVPNRIKEAAIHKWNMMVENARETAEK